jgi:hypothetical protein
VLKKAGIVVATAAAGLLAVSPLAFAGSKDHDGHRGHEGDDKRHSSHRSHDNDNNGDGDRTFVHQDGNGGNNACSNEQVGVFDADGGQGLLGLGIIPLLNGNNVLDGNNVLQCVNAFNNVANGNEVGISLFGDNRGGSFDNADLD